MTYLTTSTPEFSALADALDAIYPIEITDEWLADQSRVVRAAILLIKRIEDPPDAQPVRGDGPGIEELRTGIERLIDQYAEVSPECAGFADDLAAILAAALPVRDRAPDEAGLTACVRCGGKGYEPLSEGFARIGAPSCLACNGTGQG